MVEKLFLSQKKCHKNSGPHAKKSLGSSRIMMADDILRLVVFGGFVFALFVWAIAGLLTPIAGIWQDGELIIKIVQVGPRIKGLCRHGDGFQTFNGWIFFGRIKLKRCDFGEQRLIDMGFDKANVPLVNGKVTAFLSFRLNAEQTSLQGSFIGCRYTFSPDGQSILAVSKVAPLEREWQRRA